MPDSNPIEIKLSKIISAPKWKVIRLITHTWNFPEYISCVKKVLVLHKYRNIIRTKWRIEIEKLPISWIEEDTLALRQNTIYFQAVEGDLEVFKGKWQFREHPEGTEVTVTVYLKAGIPQINAFADAYISRLVTRNFEAILEAVEQRLVSIRYASYKEGDTAKIAGFGLIGHPYNFNHLIRYLKTLKPDFKIPSQEFLGQIFTTSPSFKLCDILNFKSRTEQSVNGCLLVVTFVPDMVERDPWAIYSKVVKACRLAEKGGVGIVSLGGFASIVSERIGHSVSEEVDVAVTTGNTFTAALAIDGVMKAADLLNVDISCAKVAIIGGRGDTGSACARVLVDKVKQLTLAEHKRTDPNLLAELAKRHRAHIIVTTDNETAVRDADIVIAAASVSASFLDIRWFKPGAIICDVGYPKNISYTATSRQDILIFSGGLAKIPTPISFPVDIGLPASDTLYGCFSEAIILALEKRYENYSVGRGNITRGKIDEIRSLGKKHGFEVSDFYWGNRLIDGAMIDKIKEAAKG